MEKYHKKNNNFCWMVFLSRGLRGLVEPRRYWWSQERLGEVGEAWQGHDGLDWTKRDLLDPNEAWLGFMMPR